MAQPQPPQLLSLDWRSKAVSHRELLTRLELLIINLDKDGQHLVAHTATTDKNVVKIHDAAGRNPAMLRTSGKFLLRSTVRQENTRLTPSQKYTNWLLYVSSNILRRCTAKTSFHKRRLFYETGDERRGLNQDTLFQMIMDLAVTIKVHPYRLGLKAEQKSQVFVPEGSELRLNVVENIFHYNDQVVGSLQSRHFNGGQSYAIPGMIESLSIISSGDVVRAVFITEHLNIKDALQSMTGSTAWNDLRGVMVVMTAGFPDFAVREFLCLLNKYLRRVPFLWFSDGDAHGIAKYLQCKYGSRPTAFASPIMVCPQLFFVGMQQSILDAYADKYPSRYLARRKLRPNANLTPEQELAVLSKAEQDAAYKKQNIMSRHLTGNKLRAHNNRLKGLRNLGYLEGGRETEVEVVVASLEQGGVPLKLSSVSDFDPHGILFVLRDAVLSALNEEPEELPLVQQMDSLRLAIEQYGSQVHGSNSIPQQQEEVVLDVDDGVVMNDDELAYAG